MIAMASCYRDCWSQLNSLTFGLNLELVLAAEARQSIIVTASERNRI